MTDDLNAPLGVDSQQETKRRLPMLPLVPIAAGVVGALVLGMAGAIAFIHNPLGGEPRAVTAIAAPAPRTAVATPQQAVAAAPAARPAEPEGPTVNIIDGMSGTARSVRIAASPQESAAGLDPRLNERTALGILPRVAPDGSRPRDVYARTFRLPAGADATAPRIAILIGGLGISQQSTSEALSKLPGAVSFAFAPYASDLDRIVARARADGHEAFLQIPMEPMDYPDNDPGPQTLLTTLSSERNTERLHWAMARFQGYVGLVNYMGAKFTATESAVTPILREANRRGLMMIDDGTSARSLIPQIATVLQQPVLRGDIHLDRVPTPTEVDTQLGRLEARARERGFALGVGSALPVTIDRVARWARELEGRGFVLVPVSNGVARRQPAG
ncbi:MAG: divergent polysaccharide deacetylase family protein [Phreatobacter sp.]|uniref:divergent polysaccharide deacetylase family protein n=1 Tax=Phreatobacter sp. TaxID=1966341 RepID=UPI00273775D0|nr:divergent polysaccharide deacetylase family protein [Phreatobacter sp.]MDP2802579.1 divergent polysaccharide deacetylase family protein [Phreatobacter sp.]